MGSSSNEGPPAQSPSPSSVLPPLSGAGLDDLLRETLVRVDGVMQDQRRLRLLLDAVVGIAADLSLDSVLARIVQVASELADARYAALGVLGGGSEQPLRAFIHHGISEGERQLIGDLPSGHGLLGLIIDRPEPLRLHDIAEDPASYGFPEHHPEMRSFLGVPVRIGDRVFGNLYLTEKAGAGDFTEQDEAVVVALAAAAGVVIENALLYEEGARREQWLEATAEIAGSLVGGVSRGRRPADRRRPGPADRVGRPGHRRGARRGRPPPGRGGLRRGHSRPGCGGAAQRALDAGRHRDRDRRDGGRRRRLDRRPGRPPRAARPLAGGARPDGAGAAAHPGRHRGGADPRLDA